MLISKTTLRAPTLDSTLHYQSDCFYTSPTYNKSLNIFVWILPFHFQVRITKWLFHSFQKRKDIFRRSGWDSKNLPTVLCSYRVMKGLWAQALLKREVSGILSLPLKLCADSRRLLIIPFWSSVSSCLMGTMPTRLGSAYQKKQDVQRTEHSFLCTY